MYTRGMEKPRRPERPAAPERSEHMRTWRVVELFSEARDQERGTEDGHLVTDHCIAVFDGVSRNGTKYDGETPGQIAVAAVKAAFEARPDLRAVDAPKVATDAVREVSTSRGVESAALVFAALFPLEDEVVVVGDCSVLLDGKGDNPGIAPDRAKAELRRRIIARAQAEGMQAEDIFQNDPSRARMTELRTWQETYANNPDAPDLGYGVVNGTDIPEQFVQRISVPENTGSIILATDGYPPHVLRETLAETEAALLKAQLEDPLGIDQTKSVRVNMPRRGQTATDDRTYIKIAP